MKVSDLVGHKYRLVRVLGEGATGAVFEAENELVGRMVALKVLKPEAKARGNAKQTLLDEARAATRINHRNVVDVFDVGQTDEGDPYLVMELLHGETLEQVLERGKVAFAYACELMVQVLTALDAAHQKGIVHRDLKPANVMVMHDERGDTNVKVLDFGIATKIDAGEEKEGEGRRLYGTPDYMSPEQVMGERATPASDIYAAGAVLYELITGLPPSSGDTLQALFINIIKEPPAPPRLIVTDIPPVLEAWVLKALDKKPDRRPESAMAMAEGILPFCRRATRERLALHRTADTPIPLMSRAKVKQPAPKPAVIDMPPPPPLAPREPSSPLIEIDELSDDDELGDDEEILIEASAPEPMPAPSKPQPPSRPQPPKPPPPAKKPPGPPPVAKVDRPPPSRRLALVLDEPADNSEPPPPAQPRPPKK